MKRIVLRRDRGDGAAAAALAKIWQRITTLVFMSCKTEKVESVREQKTRAHQKNIINN